MDVTSRDRGALRALFQQWNVNLGKEGHQGMDNQSSRKVEVLVSFHPCESGLIVLAVHGRPEEYTKGLGGGAGPWESGPLMCDLVMDDMVELKLCGKDLAALVGTRRKTFRLEFGRAVDLDIFQRTVVTCCAYFRKLLTLKTIFADRFWQGFSEGAGEMKRCPVCPRVSSCYTSNGSSAKWIAGWGEARWVFCPH
ncbi:unnamed protein product [Choristocarpus tenellus]